jgi:hypothetical protein
LEDFILLRYNINMSYQLKVIKDYPLGFWPLDESSGTIAADRSGCGNNATYVGSPASNILPLVSGGQSGTLITNTAYVTVPITKDYYSKTVSASFATKYTSDNDFSIELWINQSIESSSEVRLFADTTNNIGLFWDNGHIVFKVSATEYLIAPVIYSKKMCHIVGVYTGESIELYIDGMSADSKSLTSFKFTNSSLSLQIGPTTVSGDAFIVDAPAVYRYALSNKKVFRHFIDGNVTSSAVQIAYPDNGVLYSGSDANLKSTFDYSYPVNKRWESLLDDNTYYDLVERHIGFLETETAVSRTFVINDYIVVPLELGLVTSKVEWRNDIGITVESSLDGITYVECKNGEPIPQYTKDSFATTGALHIRITMSTTDASKYRPTLSFFCVAFYSNKDLYADNYGDKITSNTEYYLGSVNYPILSRNYTNGIRPKNGSGFNINTLSSIKSVEMFFTPLTLASNTLFYASDPSATRFAWNGSGVVSKANIQKIYVNNVDVTNQTNISSYLVAEQPHHIVIVFTTPVTGSLQLNYEVSAGPSNLYKNITTYEKEITAGIVETHYELYTGRAVSTVSEPEMDLTESGFIAYNNDWIVLQSV